MIKAQFRFYANLNDFLPSGKQQTAFRCSFGSHETVKHILEALGVPHTEVDLILVNGVSVPFDAFLENGDRVSIFPPFHTLDTGPLSEVTTDPPAVPRFVLDNHLGKLASYLRLLGFDALYRNDYDDSRLAKISKADQRILLSRDRGLLKRKNVTHGCCIRDTDPSLQLIQVIYRYHLLKHIRFYRRCVNCNGILAPVPKSLISGKLEPLTRKYFDDFRQCRDCGQIYWEGSHFKAMDAFFRDILQKAENNSGEWISDDPGR